MTINLSDCDLSGAKLIRANLTEANLSGAKLSGAEADADTKFPAGFDIANSGIIIRLFPY